MRKWLVRGGGAAVVVVAFFALRATVWAPQPVPVRTVSAERGLVEETVTNSRAGTVRARRRARLSPEVGGQAVALPRREGERVAAGEIVLRLDDAVQRGELDLTLRQLSAAEAERERSCVAAERAGRELERVRRLAAEEIVSADLLDEVESRQRSADAACEAARAQVGSAEAAVRVARTALAKTTLRAPFDGVVAELSIEVGEWTTPSPPALPVPPVIDILDPTSIYISAPMDEVDSARIRPGLPVRATVDSHRDRTFAARVRRVAPYVLDVEEQNRTVEIEVELEEAVDLATLLPGTSADVEVILSSRSDVLRIPTSALLEGGRVLVLAGERLEERVVEAGIRNWDFTEVVSGLAPGDRVVVSLDRPEVKAGALAVEEGEGEGE